MKLDHEIIRDVLLAVERDHQAPEWELVIPNSDFPRFYAADKLREGRFIRAEIVSGSDGDESIHIYEITYSGHLLLDTIRDPKAWAAVKRVARAAGNVGVQTLFEIAKREMIDSLQNLSAAT